MKAYSGQTRGERMNGRLVAAGVGECWTAGQDYWPPRRRPYFIDCGTFGPWRRGESWDPAPFMEALRKCRSDDMPDFVVAPDIIGGGLESLRLSLAWDSELHHQGHAVFLAVQDGMSIRNVGRFLDRFDGLFVGGTLAWKIRTAAEWVRLAHEHGKPCHVGRVGIAKRVRWAQRIGADSIDSNQPLWSHANMTKWLASMRPSPHLEFTW